MPEHKPDRIDSLFADLMGITAGPLNTLRRHDPQSGVGLWTLQLDSPAVAVHLADGTSLKLHGLGATAENASTVVVGTLHGNMYALPVPADWLQSGLPPQSLDQSYYSESESASGAEVAAHPSVQDSKPDASSGQLISMDKQHAQCAQRAQQAQGAQQAEEVKPHLGPPDAQMAACLEERSRKAFSERRKKPGQSRVPSTALMQLPKEPSDRAAALWQCPASLHSVVTTTAPQSFLPNLTDAGSQAEEEMHLTQQPYELGTGHVYYAITFPDIVKPYFIPLLTQSTHVLATQRLLSHWPLSHLHNASVPLACPHSVWPMQLGEQPHTSAQQLLCC